MLHDRMKPKFDDHFGATPHGAGSLQLIIITSFDPCQEILGLHKAIHLRLALLTTRIEMRFHPCAILFNGLLKGLLLTQVSGFAIFVLLRISSLAFNLCKLLLCLHFRCTLSIKGVLQGRTVLQVSSLCIGIVSLRCFHFILSVLLDHLKNGNDASRFTFAPSIITSLPSGLGGLVLIYSVLHFIWLFLDKFKWNLVVFVKFRQRNNGLLNQGNCIGIILQCLFEGYILILPHLKELFHIRFGLGNLSLKMFDGRLQLRLGVTQALKLFARLVDVMIQIFHVIGVLVLGTLAPITMGNVLCLFRTEEAEDIAHRDRCQGSQNKNTNDMEDLDHDVDKAGKELERLGDTKAELEATIEHLEGEIAETKSNMEELLEMRQDEDAAFKQALKDDADAVALIEQAIVSLSEFYKNNKIPLELVQKQPDEVEYTVDEDKAPETTWKGGDYGGRKSESGGIIAILEMIKEDTQNEMKTSKADDADAQAAYLKNRASLQDTFDAQRASKVQAEKELAEVEGKTADTKEYKNGKAADLSEEQSLEKSIEKDCAWVKSHFDSRREKRKTEMDGLVEAKNFLAGVEAGDDDES